MLNQSWLQLRDYQIKINQLTPWLSSCEHKLALIMSGEDKEDTNAKLKELKVLCQTSAGCLMIKWCCGQQSSGTFWAGD